MTLLSYEHHTNITDIHDTLNRFGTFAGSCGWTVEYNLTNVGTWNTTTGVFNAGTATFLMISQTGAGCGNHSAQNMCYQFLSELKGTNQGSISPQGRVNTATRVIGDPSCRTTHPLSQFPNFTDQAARRYFCCNGLNPPNVWFFGNSKFLAIHVDNDGVSNSGLHLGTWNVFDKTATNTDTTLNFLFNFKRETNVYEWDTPAGSVSSKAYWTSPRLGNDNSQNVVLKGVGLANAGNIQEDFGFEPVSATLNFSYASYYFSNRRMLLDDSLPYSQTYNGYKMSYASYRLMLKPNAYWKDSVAGFWRPLGMCEHYICYVQGLATGATVTNGSKQFLCFPGFNRKNFGIAYRIA